MPSILSTQESELSISASQTWTANRALYIPFHIEVSTTIQRIAIYNSSTATQNFDVGIYQLDGTRLRSSGSTAQAGVVGVQIVNIASIVLSTGRYYMAFACNAASTFSGANAEGIPVVMMGVKIEESAFPLPATATFSDPSSTTTDFVVFGLLEDAA